MTQPNHTLNSTKPQDVEAEHFRPVDLGDDATVLGQYVVKNVSVFDHWLDESEAAESGIMSYKLSVDSGQIEAYLAGEKRLLDFYKELAREGVIVDRPGPRRSLQSHDPEFEGVVRASLREDRFMDAYFLRCKVRIIGHYDRTDLALFEGEASVDDFIRLATNHGLHLLK